MLGLAILGIIGFCVFVGWALHESEDIHDNSPPAPETKDHYSV